jgi:SRSO17 transposase
VAVGSPWLRRSRRPRLLPGLRPRGYLGRELIRICQDRRAIEGAFEVAKGELGMDHYEVRRWEAWYRYITLCLLARAFLVVTRLAASREDAGAKKGISIPA